MKVKINLIPKTMPCEVYCSQDDTGLRKFQFEVYNGLDRWNIDCDYVNIQISNGVQIAGDVEGNVVMLPCTAEMSAIAGEFITRLQFIKGEEKVHTGCFKFIVERRP